MHGKKHDVIHPRIQDIVLIFLDLWLPDLEEKKEE
jgi:hypothetical protein